MLLRELALSLSLLLELFVLSLSLPLEIVLSLSLPLELFVLSLLFPLERVLSLDGRLSLDDWRLVLLLCRLADALLVEALLLLLTDGDGGGGAGGGYGPPFELKSLPPALK